MNRRALLALLAAGAAGCAGDRSDEGGAPTETDRPTEQTDSPAPTPPRDPDVDAAPGDCPAFGDATVVCTGAADDPALVMARPTEAATLPADLTFTLRNGTEAPFSTNFYAWSLQKRVDGRWFDIAPQFAPQPLYRLQPGATHEWDVRVDGALPDDPVTLARGNSSVALSALGGGRYAFGVTGWFGETANRYAAVAPVDLQGDPLALRPTDAVTDVRVDGDRVAARLDRDAGDDARLARYTLTRAEDDPDAPRRITEQVVRASVADDPLRDALALAVDRGAREVRLRGPTTTRPPFGVDAGGRRLRYEGRTYEVRAAAAGTPDGR